LLGVMLGFRLRLMMIAGAPWLVVVGWLRLVMLLFWFRAVVVDWLRLVVGR